ncbi:hypothetical protein [Bacillus sp. 7884-1]|uniref:hypothetical protein n=1 Tax=Bacillus sp. 7884-1 TaxID=2021693 RepID=UPI00211C2831|nr:hypothetical protein [Bacillus sp. 7884-1]
MRYQDWIDAKVISGDVAKTPTFAFLGVVDSIILELAYGNDEKRLRSLLDSIVERYFTSMIIQKEVFIYEENN